MRVLYLECASGASGDMMLGALIDLGVPIEVVREAVASLGVREFENGGSPSSCEIVAERVVRGGIAATKFCVRDRASGRAVDETPVGPTSEHDHHHHHPHTHHHDHDHGHADAHHHDHGHPHLPPHAPSVEAEQVVSGHAHAAAHDHVHRGLADVCALIERSSLSGPAKAKAVELFARLADAEAAVHGVTRDVVHFHEVGAIDSIVDIIGCVVALEWLAVDEVVASPLNTGHGTVRCAHGVLPVPAPATARLLDGVPVYADGPATELLTPTGALLVTSYATGYGPLPAMSVTGVGYGAGTRDFADRPNVLRAWLGTREARPAAETLVEITCDIDDMNPQLFGPLLDRLYAAGALEVFYQPIQMKKQRPGTLVSVLAEPGRRGGLVDVLFRETTTLGVRYHEVHRDRLDREMVEVATPYGVVRAKVARRGGVAVTAMPEFDDCVRLAAAEGLAVRTVHAAAFAACQVLVGPPDRP